MKKLGLGGSTTWQQPFPENPFFFNEREFSLHLLCFFHKVVCVHKVVHVVFSSVFVL